MGISWQSICPSIDAETVRRVHRNYLSLFAHSLFFCLDHFWRANIVDHEQNADDCKADDRAVFGCNNSIIKCQAQSRTQIARQEFSIGAEALPAVSAVPHHNLCIYPDWRCRYAVWRNIPQCCVTLASMQEALQI